MKPPKEIFLARLTFSYAITISLILFGYEPVSSRPHSKRASFYIANETVCVVDDVIYHNSDPIPSDDPCETCKCRPPGFACVLRKCEVKPGCKAVRKEGECCPQYVCGCEHNSVIYKNGDVIRNTESPCYTCYCQGSSIACALVDCYFRHDCAPKYVPGECCPRYDDCPPEKTPVPPSSNETVSVTSIPSVTYTYAPRTAPSHSYSSGEEKRHDQQVNFNEVPIDQPVVYADGDAVSAITYVRVEESTSIHVISEPTSTQSPTYDNDVVGSETPMKLTDFSRTSTLPDMTHESELPEATTFLLKESLTDETSSSRAASTAATLEPFTPTSEFEEKNSTTKSPLIELKILLSNISTLSDPELSTLRIEDETKTTHLPVILTSSSSDDQTLGEKDVDTILNSKNPTTKNEIASTTELPNSIENNLNIYLGPIVSDVEDIHVKSGAPLEGEIVVTQTDTSKPVVPAKSDLEDHEEIVDREEPTTVQSLDITSSSHTSTFAAATDFTNANQENGSKESTTEVVVSVTKNPDQAVVTEDSANINPKNQSEGNVVVEEIKVSVNKVELVSTALVPDVANFTGGNEEINEPFVKIDEENLEKNDEKNQSVEDLVKKDEVADIGSNKDEEIGQKENATTEKVELLVSDDPTVSKLIEDTTILPVTILENGETPLKLSTQTSFKEENFNLNNDDFTKDSSADATTVANTPEAVANKEISEDDESIAKQSSTANPIFSTEPSLKEHSESEKKYIYHFIHRSGSHDHFAPELRGSVELSETDNVGVPIGYSNDFALDIRSLMASEINSLDSITSSSSHETSETTTQQSIMRKNEGESEMKPVEIDLAVVEDRLEELKKESLSKTTTTGDVTTSPLPIGIKRFVEHTGEIELSRTSTVKYQKDTSEMTAHSEVSTESASASSEESYSEQQSISGQITTESGKNSNTAPTRSKNINNLPTTISAQLHYGQDKHDSTLVNVSESAVNSTKPFLDGTTVSTVLESKHTITFEASEIESKNDESKILSLTNGEKIISDTILPSITTTTQSSSYPSVTESNGNDRSSIDDKTAEVTTASDTLTKQSTTWQTIKFIFNDLTTTPSAENTRK